MKKILLPFLIVLLLGVVVKAQEKEKITEVFHSETETIKNFKETENFIGITTFEDKGSKREYYAYILDPSNNVKFKITSKTGYISQTIPLENNQSFLILERPSEAEFLINSYDLNNGSLNWKKEIRGYNFSISRNQNYLLAPKQPEDNNEAKFQIIDLESGISLNINNNFTNYVAEFYDEQRIVFFIQEIERNSEFYTDTPEIIQLKNRLNEINDIAKEIWTQMSNKIITKSKYDEKSNELMKESTKLRSKINDLRYDNRKISPWKRKPLKVLIYNFKDGFVEQEKEIRSNSGAGIYLKTSDMGIGVINVNQFGEIFFLCYEDDEIKFGKLNMGLEIEWLINYESGRIIKITDSDNLFFVCQKLNDQTLYEINPQNGELISNESLSLIKENLSNIGYTVNLNKKKIILEKDNQLQKIQIGGDNE